MRPSFFSSSYVHTRAVMFMFSSVFLYGLQDTFVKNLPSSVSLVEIVFYRSLFGFITIFFMMRLEKKTWGKNLFKTDRPFAHFLRCLFSTATIFCFILSFRMIPLADAYAFSFSTPLFMAFLAPFILGEKVSLQRWVAVTFGFMGVLIMLRPGFGDFRTGSYIALLGGIFYAFQLMYTRDLSKKDSNTLIVSSFALMCLVVSGALMPFYAQMLDLKIILMFITLGVLGMGGQFSMAQAFRLAPVSAIAPFDYAALLWATFLGYVFWNDLPDGFMIAGALCVTVAGIYLIRHERALEARVLSKTGGLLRSL